MAVSLSGPSGSSHVCNSMETLPEASAPASELPRKQGSRSATGSIKSHSSQGKSAVMGKRVSKENDRALRTQLQVSTRLQRYSGTNVRLLLHYTSELVHHKKNSNQFKSSKFSYLILRSLQKL